MNASTNNTRLPRRSSKKKSKSGAPRTRPRRPQTSSCPANPPSRRRNRQLAKGGDQVAARSSFSFVGLNGGPRVQKDLGLLGFEFRQEWSRMVLDVQPDAGGAVSITAPISSAATGANSLFICPQLWPSHTQFKAIYEYVELVSPVFITYNPATATSTNGLICIYVDPNFKIGDPDLPVDVKAASARYNSLCLQPHQTGSIVYHAQVENKGPTITNQDDYFTFRRDFRNDGEQVQQLIGIIGNSSYLLVNGYITVRCLVKYTVRKV